MRRTLIAVAFGSALAACGDGPKSAFVRARIDGVNWSTEDLNLSVVSAADDQEGPPWVIVILAMRDFHGFGGEYLGFGGEYLGLGVPTAPGTYDLGVSHFGMAGVVSPDTVNTLADCGPWAAMESDPGTLTITRVEPSSGRIEGSFEFTGHPLDDSKCGTRAITSGYFVIYAPGVFILE